MNKKRFFLVNAFGSILFKLHSLSKSRSDLVVKDIMFTPATDSPSIIAGGSLLSLLLIFDLVSYDHSFRWMKHILSSSIPLEKKKPDISTLETNLSVSTQGPIEVDSMVSAFTSSAALSAAII
mmetsp:Transcript_15454/g.20757  ORF Transcript_15454/g.20757 Transcript_15454/m.20757 type:complete len:123 (-) Transcript_15454:777-1145(-)